MSDDDEQYLVGDGARRNVFEQNDVVDQSMFGETHKVPLKLNGEVVGEAEVYLDENGVHVASTSVTDPFVQGLLEDYGTKNAFSMAPKKAIEP